MKPELIVENVWGRVNPNESDSAESQRLRTISNEFRSINENTTIDLERERVEDTVTLNETAITHVENQATAAITTLSDAAIELNNVSTYWPMLGVLGLMAITAVAYIYITRNNEGSGSSTVSYSIFGYKILEKTVKKK